MISITPLGGGEWKRGRGRMKTLHRCYCSEGSNCMLAMLSKTWNSELNTIEVAICCKKERWRKFSIFFRANWPDIWDIFCFHLHLLVYFPEEMCILQRNVGEVPKWKTYCGPTSARHVHVGTWCWRVRNTESYPAQKQRYSGLSLGEFGHFPCGELKDHLTFTARKFQQNKVCYKIYFGK